MKVTNLPQLRWKGRRENNRRKELVCVCVVFPAVSCNSHPLAITPHATSNKQPTVATKPHRPGPGDLSPVVLSFRQGAPAMEYFGPGGWALMLTAAVIGPGLFRVRQEKGRKGRSRRRQSQPAKVQHQHQHHKPPVCGDSVSLRKQILQGQKQDIIRLRTNGRATRPLPANDTSAAFLGGFTLHLRQILLVLSGQLPLPLSLSLSFSLAFSSPSSLSLSGPLFLLSPVRSSSLLTFPISLCVTPRLTPLPNISRCSPPLCPAAHPSVSPRILPDSPRILPR